MNYTSLFILASFVLIGVVTIQLHEQLNLLHKQLKDNDEKHVQEINLLKEQNDEKHEQLKQDFNKLQQEVNNYHCSSEWTFVFNY